MLEDLKVRGRIFNIQRFSIHDGHGIPFDVVQLLSALRTKVSLLPNDFEFRDCHSPTSSAFSKST